MAQRDLDRLAGKLGQPPASLAAFSQLAPGQIELLSDAIDAACARRSLMLDSALEQAMPALPARAIAKLLRGRGG